MLAPRRFPKNEFDLNASAFDKVFRAFSIERRAVLAYGFSLIEGILSLVCEANEVSEMLKRRPWAVNPLRLNPLIPKLEKATKDLIKIQFKYLTALCTHDLLRARIKALHPTVYSMFKERIEARMREWDSLRLMHKVNLSQVRSAYSSLNQIIEKAEAMPVDVAVEKERQARVAGKLHLILTPSVSKPAPDKKKDKRLRDQQIRTGMKGSETGRVGVSQSSQKQKAG